MLTNYQRLCFRLSWGSVRGRFVIHWREEDSRHGISGKIADGFYGR